MQPLPQGLPANAHEAWWHATQFLFPPGTAASASLRESLRSVFYVGMTYGAHMATSHFVDAGSATDGPLTARVAAGIDRMIALSDELMEISMDERMRLDSKREGA